MASLYPGHFNAVQVGAYFLEHYYRILQKKPELVHQFYTEGSSMVRIDGTATESATGMVQIHNLVMCLNFKGIEIKSAHSLESLNGGVLVMVSGYVQLEDYSIRRKFVQTFFLAPQEKGYYIRNDIFHFLEEEQIYEHPAAIVSQTDFESKLNMSSPVPEAVPDYMLRDEIQAQDMLPLVHVEENNTVEKYSNFEAPQLSVSDERLDESPAEETTPIALEITRDPPPATPEEPVGEPTKHTYASILRAKGQFGPSMHSTSVVKTEQAHLFSQQSHPVVVPENFGSVATDEALVVEDEGDARSVYVGNLPSSVSTSDLEQVFKNFGRLRSDGVFIRSRKESDVFYAFIEYQDAIGVQNALKASPIQLNGRLIHVEGEDLTVVYHEEEGAEVEVTRLSSQEDALVVGLLVEVSSKKAVIGTILVGQGELDILNEFKKWIIKCSNSKRRDHDKLQLGSSHNIGNIALFPDVLLEQFQDQPLVFLVV